MCLVRTNNNKITPYSSSLTDNEWSVIQPLLCELLDNKKQTRPLKRSYRLIFDGILYQLKNGCNWADLPRDFPPYSTIYWHYKQWKDNGIIDTMMHKFHESVREKENRNKWTTLIIIDSQAVKNTCNASAETSGFCFYKATNGIKRHLAVDILGFPLLRQAQHKSLHFVLKPVSLMMMD